jgi:hypothetical protein
MQIDPAPLRFIPSSTRVFAVRFGSTLLGFQREGVANQDRPIQTFVTVFEDVKEATFALNSVEASLPGDPGNRLWPDGSPYDPDSIITERWTLSTVEDEVMRHGLGIQLIGWDGSEYPPRRPRGDFSYYRSMLEDTFTKSSDS